MALISNCQTLAKIKPGEEMFVLRAQDFTAPETVIQWISLNIRTASVEKLREAFECALRMRKWNTKKAAD